jgi:putative glutathione S-transferase
MMIRPGLEDGVYKSGFATSQAAYEKNVIPLFESLDKLENILSTKEYLVGDQLTEADVRLWVTIVRSPALPPSIASSCVLTPILARSGSTLCTLGTSSATSRQSVPATLPSASTQPCSIFRRSRLTCPLPRTRWLKKLYWTNEAFKTSTNFEHIKTHYYWSQTLVRRPAFFLLTVP